MHKFLTAISVVALIALGTSIVATVLLHSSIARQSGQIRALERAESTDHKKIAALETEMAASGKGKTLTAARRTCRQLPQPMGQPGFAAAAPELLFTIRQASSTASNALAGIPFSSDTKASGHCG
jgi:hypothetical protein